MILQCNECGKFIITDFIKHLENCGIGRNISCPKTPEQNGVSEREPRHIVFDENTLPFEPSNQTQTNIDAPPPLAIFVQFFLKIAGT